MMAVSEVKVLCLIPVQAVTLTSSCTSSSVNDILQAFLLGESMRVLAYRACTRYKTVPCTKAVSVSHLLAKHYSQTRLTQTP
jgi:hypothetical protein